MPGLAFRVKTLAPHRIVGIILETLRLTGTSGYVLVATDADAMLQLAIPAEVAGMTALRELEMVSTVVPAHLSACTGLTDLTIGYLLNWNAATAAQLRVRNANGSAVTCRAGHAVPACGTTHVVLLSRYSCQHAHRQHPTTVEHFCGLTYWCCVAVTADSSGIDAEAAAAAPAQQHHGFQQRHLRLQRDVQPGFCPGKAAAAKGTPASFEVVSTR